MKNKTVKNLIFLGALAIAFVAFNSAQAYVPGVWEPTAPVDPNPVFTNVVSSPTNPLIVDTTTPVTTSVTPKISDPVKPTKNTTTTPKSTKTEVVKSDTNSNLPPVQEAENSNNDLTALSFEGNGGFMPSSIWQWILVVFLILIIIIIARTLSKPKAHGHDPHGHPAPAH